MTAVLDTTAFIVDHQVDDELVTVPSVKEELEGDALYQFEVRSGGGMQLQVPGSSARQRVL
ncbi:MAG: DNA-binding protein, partial [Halobacteriaceae archaeon]